MTTQLSDPEADGTPALPGADIRYVVARDVTRPLDGLEDPLQNWSDRSTDEGTQLLADYERVVNGLGASTLFTHIPEWFAQLMSIDRASHAATALTCYAWPIEGQNNHSAAA